MNAFDFSTPDWVKVGAIFRMVYGKDHHGNRRVHIRAIVDDDYVVTRQWSKRRQDWIYKIEPGYVMAVYAESEHFRLVKRGD